MTLSDLFSEALGVHKLSVLILSLLPSVAAAIPLDIGEPRGRLQEIFFPEVSAGLTGTPFQGQTVSLDFTFTEGRFLRVVAFPLAGGIPNFYFQPMARIDTTALPAGQFTIFPGGSGYLIGADGLPVLSLTGDPSAFSAGANQLEALGYFVNHTLPRTFDVYGAHLEIQLPTYPGAITGEPQLAIMLPYSGYFNVRENVPDNGGGVWLLLTALSGMSLCAYPWRKRRQIRRDLISEIHGF